MAREKLSIETVQSRARMADNLLKFISSGGLNPASVDDETAMNRLAKTVTEERDKWTERLRLETV